MANQYIKVTLAGETKSHILLASLRDFYLAQGAKVEIPTEEEVQAVFPTTEEKKQTSQEELNELRKEKEALAKQYNDAVNQAKKQEATIKELRGQVKVLQTSLDEAEVVIANLKKQANNQ
jgi:peptidoglycan hydrolase CwlO-like protein